MWYGTSLPLRICLRRPTSRKTPSMQRHAGDKRCLRFGASRKQRVHRALLEHVEYDLNRVDQTQSSQIDALVGPEIAYGNADLIDLPFDAQRIERLEPVEGMQAVPHPAVQLKKIDPIDTEPPQRILDVVAQVPVGITAPHRRVVMIRIGPDDGLRLGGYINLAALPFLQRLADHLFTMALAVKLGRVNEVDAFLVG